jgi:hypothetical protein
VRHEGISEEVKEQDMVDTQHMADAKETGAEDRQSRIHVTVIVQNRCTFDTEVVTGRQIRERANVPAGFSLHCRVVGGNEPIGEDDPIELHDGDHLFCRPPSTAPMRNDDRNHLRAKGGHAQ